MWEFWRDGHRYAVEGRFWCTGYNPRSCTAIVAQVSGTVDWSANIGTETDDGTNGTEKRTCLTAMNKGAKLLEEDARHFFPQFKAIPYRG